MLGRQPWVSHGLHNTWASRPGESYVIDGEPVSADPEILTYFMGQPTSAGRTSDVGCRTMCLVMGQDVQCEKKNKTI